MSLVTDALRRVAGTVLAIIAAFCAVPSPAMATPTTLPATAYTYDDSAMPAVQNHSITERGPPDATYGYASYDAVDRWSRGAPARSGDPATPAIYDYDDLALLVQSARGSGNDTEGPVDGAEAGSDVVQRLRVAANEGDGLLASRLRGMQSERGAAGLPGRGDLSFARKVKLAPDNPAVINRGMPVQDFVSQFRNAKILRELPGEVLDMSVEDALRAGNSTVRKLLTDGRWSR